MQGVFFRRFAASWAASLQITGFARNLFDGRTVEIVAQGGEHNILEFIKHLKKGPPEALVEDVRVEKLPDSPSYDKFSVK